MPEHLSLALAPIKEFPQIKIRLFILFGRNA